MPRTTPEFRVPSPVERLFNRIFGFLVGLGFGFRHNYLFQVAAGEVTLKKGSTRQNTACAP
jgi:hypothetical protein